MIELRNVSLRYVSKSGFRTLNELEALRNVNLVVEKGSFTSIVGPSGCGKTTILKIVSGLIQPSEGEVYINRKKVEKPLPIVGMAFQNPVLLPWRSVLQNILLPLEVVEPHRSQLQKNRSIYVDKALQLLRLVGLEGFADKKPWELSGGMQQRVSLCRALIHDPEILLLDEPFGALDLFTREELWNVLQNLWLQTRCTVLMVTHDLREAIYLSDMIYVMSKRPGTVIGTMVSDYPRPRAIDITYEERFVDQMHRLREMIQVK
ncbi:Bicarbonate transport ATP-binding protein CmpD [archaeon HR03]|uniref:Sulfonate/nitrate/taurine ABC transporter ATP-binding protein n=1 Tax=Caldiarchaeum subterraneum TaxID=311458 RepID=E6NBD7_CALS0|nr:sulfonate/nitrate/taurine ABC transporter ATP-binding protein [Candidatus Caldarchaeum subterraneum]GBC72402.1 Bicarbonate transport ATP-binding protein CmpD [archaeon HR03]